MAISAPLAYAGPVLEVIQLPISFLPLLQRNTAAHEAELNWRNNELEALNLDLLSERSSEIEANRGTAKPS